MGTSLVSTKNFFDVTKSVLRAASSEYLLVANTTVAYIGMLLDRAYFIDRLVTEFNLSMIHPMSGNMFASYITTHSM